MGRRYIAPTAAAPLCCLTTSITTLASNSSLLLPVASQNDWGPLDMLILWGPIYKKS